MILVIDNYDSFTYNLVQYLGELGARMEVVRNDALDADAIAAMRPERVVISPGPGTPDQAGVSIEVIRRLGGTTPILGVCLGHQAIGRAFGATVARARTQMHGKTSAIRHDGRGVFAGLSNPFVATRYHSLAVVRGTVPPDLEVTAEAEDGEIMGLRHRRWPIEGVQFHPESILTVEGKTLLGNFLGAGAAG
ncbi:MAG: aminodeoxychorismate/anthranilate synthase component II [Candidatus Rokubacteria bacterium]|nr:aminodeoxychorismate/anthranilate synthase component II [Candidatus Rokubacteria bacterium]MBI2014851.1 aminodeoxychorismate/anthranilate synthase component II [Candidatus Rokubacteria bacterium]MBI2156758.1 aminodeoxychorismate/anthranilate synthase component II [Candidatus Rokubacteria bacterium]MBI4629817.1 aminodeoxychorismate/anthranilate synthase component II [Candidatus Rokubacteria bacterium]